MPYIGRDLNRGNYLKLDDISSSFNGSTQTFNLTVGGSAFTPGSAFSILVSVGGVIQEPESAYQVNNSEITFANAPTAQDSFFCIALGVSLGIGVPGNGTVNGTQMAKPFNYDGYFYLDDVNNRVGINSSTPTVALDVIGNTNISGDVNVSGILTAGTYSGPISNPSGISTFYNLRVSNNLTVEGTTTTLDTNVTGVDRLEINANSNTDTAIVGIQSGTADILNLYDGSTEVFSVADGGGVRATGAITAHDFRSGDGVGNTLYLTSADDWRFRTTGGAEKLRITSGGSVLIDTTVTTEASADGNDLIIGSTSDTQKGISIVGSTTNGVGNIFFTDGASYKNQGIIQYRHADDSMRFTTAQYEALRILSDGKVGIGTQIPAEKLSVEDSSPAILINATSATGESKLQFGRIGNTNVGEIKYEHSNNAFTFRTNDTADRLRIDSTGRVLIGVNAATNNDSYVQAFKATGNDATITVGNVATSASGLCRYDFAPSNKVVGSRIECHATEDFSTSANRTADLVFITRKDGTLSEKLRITSGGHVNIGGNYTQTSYRLHVDGGIEATSSFACVNNVSISGVAPQIIFTDTNQDSDYTIKNDFGSLQFIDRTNSNAVRMYANTAGFGGTRLYIADDIVHTGDTDTKIEFDTNTINFDTAGGERLRINSIGEVYIGSSTTNGQGKLFVNDSSGATTTRAHIRNATATGTAESYYNLDDAKFASVGLENGELVFRNSTDSTPEIRMLIKSDGKVGIGTLIPQTKFEVSSATGTRIRARHTNTTAGRDAGFDIWSDDSGTFAARASLVHSGSAGRTTLYAQNRFNIHSDQTTTSLYIARDGKVGIGTDNPTHELTLFGDDPIIEIIEKSANSKVTIGTGTVQGFINIQKADATRTVQISSDGDTYFNGGNVGINDNNPAALLTVNNGTSDAQFVQMKNDNVGLFFGAYGTGHGSYPREATINGSRTDAGSSPFLRLAGQGGIKFCVDLNTPRMQITSGKIKLFPEGDLGGGATGTPLYLQVSTDMTAPNTPVGGNDGTGVFRIEDRGGNNNRYHGIEFRNRNSGDVRILNQDVAASNGANLVFAVDDAGQFTGASTIREYLRIGGNGVTSAKTLSGNYYPVASTRDGSTSARAASSAWEIKKTLGPAAKTGYYYLKDTTGTVAQWWCDMDTDGGGWILIAHHGEGTMADQGTTGAQWWHATDRGGFDTVGSGFKIGGGYWRGSGGEWAENTCGELMWDVRINGQFGTNPSYGDYGQTGVSNHKVAFRWGTDQPLPTGNSDYTNIPNAGNRRFNEWCREVENAPGFNPGNYHQNARSNIISGGNYFTEHMCITWCFRQTGGAADDGDSGPYWFIGAHANGLHQHYEEGISGDVYGDGAVQLVSNQDTSWGSNPGGTNQSMLRLSKISDTGTVNIWLR